MQQDTSSHEAFTTVFARALPYLQTRHNELHTRISLDFAKRLLAAEGGDPRIVIPAILLHDIGWSKVPEAQQLLAFGPNVKDPDLTRVHEREGARMAEEILVSLGYEGERVGEIVSIIAGHDTRPESSSLHESIVRDADKLFRLSERGFAIDCERFEQDPAAYLGWVEEQIAHWFFTTSGAELARQETAARYRELRSAQSIA
jgi:HD superfamily phosphodiesterase